MNFDSLIWKQKSSYPEKTFQVNAAAVQGSMEMVNGVFDGVVFCHQVNESETMRRFTEMMSVIEGT